MITMKKGNIFTTECQTIVNTINCVGFMGKGIAYEFKLRFQDMFETYKKLCDNKQIDIGKLWIYKIPENMNYKYRLVLNFPTKKDYKDSSEIVYLEKGLQKFIDTYEEKNIKSIAFPILGASNGNINTNTSIQIMQKYLNKIEIPIEIWHFDPKASDDCYDDFKAKFLSLSDDIIKKESNLGIDFIRKIKMALNSNYIHSMSGLLDAKGIGDKTLIKSFNFIKNFDVNKQENLLI